MTSVGFWLPITVNDLLLALGFMWLLIFFFTASKGIILQKRISGVIVGILVYISVMLWMNNLPVSSLALVGMVVLEAFIVFRSQKKSADAEALRVKAEQGRVDAEDARDVAEKRRNAK